MVVGNVSEVHLFYGGPVGVAAALGAIVDNWVPVKWYIHNNNTETNTCLLGCRDGEGDIADNRSAFIVHVQRHSF